LVAFTGLSGTLSLIGFAVRAILKPNCRLKRKAKNVDKTRIIKVFLRWICYHDIELGRKRAVLVVKSSI
jgi:hypothetical protein